MQKLIAIHNGVARLPEWRLASPVSFELLEGENIAIVGPNGGGKTMFVDMLTGSHPLLGDNPTYDFGPGSKPLVSDNIKYIQFTDSYGENDSTYYLQQRWNQQEIDESTPTARQILDSAMQQAGADAQRARSWQAHLYDMFDIEHTLDKHIILLSSGELRKIQIIKALLAMPRVLIIDNPFIGLDATARGQLDGLLGELCHDGELQLILVLAKYNEIPPYITHVVNVAGMEVKAKVERSVFASSCNLSVVRLPRTVEQALLQHPYRASEHSADEVVRMKDVSIRYGSRTILDGLDWLVRNGEHWAVTGKNGSGKSTLLSLVCADNPQSYACDISLFGNRRGSGESIWDIKRHIGYVSPEAELDNCRWWMWVFGLQGCEDRPFLKLSSGQQRLALLARAFVKDPELLVLDEPLHGLDDGNRQRVKDIIETFCRRKNKTLIMVTHYMEELPPCIDHTLTLERKV